LLPRREQAVAARKKRNLTRQVEPEIGGELDLDAAAIRSDRHLDAPRTGMPPMR
jgi:hypothetical protein